MAERRFDDPYPLCWQGSRALPWPDASACHTAAATPGGEQDPALGPERHGIRPRKGKIQYCQYRRRLWQPLLAPVIEGATVYDLDLPVMLNERRRIFDYTKDRRIHNIEIDLETQAIDAVLSASSRFDPNVPTYFIWEGGSMYFRDRHIDRIFSAISWVMASGSRLWFDYVSEAIIAGTTGIREAEDFIRVMRKLGEPFVTGFSDIGPLASRYQLEIKEDVSAGSVLGIGEAVYNHYGFCVLGEG